MKTEVWTDKIAEIVQSNSAVKILKIYKAVFAVNLWEGPVCISKELIKEYEFIWDIQSQRFLGIVPKDIVLETCGVIDQISNAEFIFRRGEMTIAYIK